jgi:hypothetical protein
MIPLLVVASVIDPGGATFLGWSTDGQSLVWQTTELATSFPKRYILHKGDQDVEVPDPSKLSAEDRAKVEEIDTGDMMGAQPQTDESLTLVTVHDVRRGTDAHFILKYEMLTKEGHAATLKKKFADAGDAKAFDGWKKAHPLTKTPSKKSKAGDTNVVIQQENPEGDKPTWNKGSIGWSVPGTTTVTLSVTCGKDTAREVIQQEMAAMYMPDWTATPYWEPTGHRVLFLLEEGTVKTMRGPDGGHIEYVVVPCGPRVEVVASAGLEQAAVKVADAVEKAGFTAVSIGPAQAARPATVVYADAAHTELATKLAASIPGGATVDKLTWKPKADVVVAVGASAK